MSKYLFLGKINQEYISGMLKNPDQDRAAVLKDLAGALEANFHSLEFTCGAYDGCASVMRRISKPPSP